MRHIYAICPLYENWKPSCVQLTLQICSGAFLVFLETGYVALHATGFTRLAWPKAKNELGPLSSQTPGTVPTFLWSSCPPACPGAWQLGLGSPAGFCPLLLTMCAFLGVAIRGDSHLIFGLIFKAWDNSLRKLRRCWHYLLLSLCACFWLLNAS